MPEKGGVTVKVPADEPLADKKFSREHRIMPGKGDTALHVNGEPVERPPFKRHHFTAFFLPVRFRPALFDEVRRGPFHPLRLNISRAAGKKPACFNEFRGHEPLCGFLCQTRARPHPEVNAAGTEIRGRPEVGVKLPAADVTQKPC